MLNPAGLRVRLGDLTAGRCNYAALGVKYERGRTGGALVNAYSISGSSFLNGMTSDRDHMLWFTDFSQGRIHSLDLNTGQDQVIVAGAVAIDGVSLTVVGVSQTGFDVALIPHTLDVTTLSDFAPGDPVNLEADVLGKYVKRYLDRIAVAGENSSV